MESPLERKILSTKDKDSDQAEASGKHSKQKLAECILRKF